MGSGTAAADVGSHVNDNELTTYQAQQQNGAMRLRNCRNGGDGGSLGSSDSVDGDVVTTTHTISEMRVRERSKRGRRSEKHVVVKMAVQQKSRRRDGDSDDDEEDDRDTNRSTGNGQYDAHNRSQGITIEEIDDDDGENDAHPHVRTTSELVTVANGSNANGGLWITDVSDATVHDTMLQLLTDAERMKQYLHDQEQLFRRESDYVEQLRQEHKALKAMAKEYKCRAREQKRVQRILREAKKNVDHSHHSSSNWSSRSGKRKLKKQCKRLQQFQSELALRLEVVQSKNSVYEMHVEKQLGDLRREYSDNYLFPNPFPFQ